MRGRVPVSPCSAHSLEQGFQLLITVGPHTLICAASGPPLETSLRCRSSSLGLRVSRWSLFIWSEVSSGGTHVVSGNRSSGAG